MRKLGFDIKRYNTNFFAKLDLKCAKYNITGKQMMVIYHIGNQLNDEQDYISQQEIEKTFKINRSSVTSILQNLEKTGYILRLQDETDTRKKNICLSSEAKQILIEINEYIEEIDKKIKNSFTENEFETLRKLVSKLADISETL